MCNCTMPIGKDYYYINLHIPQDYTNLHITHQPPECVRSLPLSSLALHYAVSVL